MENSKKKSSMAKERSSVSSPPTDKLKIEVTQRDIDIGYCGHSQLCPLARACLRAVPNVHSVHLTRHMAEFRFKNEQRIEVELPFWVTVAQIDFDVNKRLKPFTFEIDNPCKLLSFGSGQYELTQVS